MSKRSAPATRVNPYERVTASIIERLEAGVVPWRQPWRNVAGGNVPRNALTARPYSGINRIVTSIAGYGDPRWLTYKQAQGLGGNVRRGQHGTPIVIWKPLDPREDDESTRYRGFYGNYTVFNVAQCSGLGLSALDVDDGQGFEPLAVAEAVLDGYDGPTLDHEGGSRAYYSPSADAVHLPARSAFVDADAYYTTAFHELAHSTGHRSRLARESSAEAAPFGSPVYSREELVAEFTAAFLSQHAGIDGTTVERSASYVAAWLGVLKADRRMAVTAASHAQRAADLILGRDAATQPSAALAVAA